MRGSVTVSIAAPRSSVWNLISDVTRIGEFSPETFEAEWTDGATGPAVGARFRGHVKRNGVGPIYWTTCIVIACDEPREFAFTVHRNEVPVNTWRYELVEQAGGTAITESFELAPSPLIRVYWAILGWRRGPANVRGMRRTLERVKTVVESRAT
jgi:ligand-binding SRPBCC domain-containing protein